jgi:hypothetical protein
MGVGPKEVIDSIERIGVWWALIIVGLLSLWLLLGGLETFVLWPELFDRFDVSKLLFVSALLTLSFVMLGIVPILLGAMDRRPFEPEVRYALFFSTLSVAVCQGAALLHMFFTVPSRKDLIWVGLISFGVCCAAGFAKRREYAEDERDLHHGIQGQKSFFRGPRKGGAAVAQKISVDQPKPTIPERYALLDEFERKVVSLFIENGVAELSPRFFQNQQIDNLLELKLALQRLEARGFLRLVEDPLALRGGPRYELAAAHFRELSRSPSWIGLNIPAKEFG